MSQIISVTDLTLLKWITGCDYLSPMTLLRSCSILDIVTYQSIGLDHHSDDWSVALYETGVSQRVLYNSYWIPCCLSSYRDKCYRSGRAPPVWFSSWSRNDESFSCLRRSNRKPFEFLNSRIPEFQNSLVTDLNQNLWSAFSITMYGISLKLTAGRADINECILKLHLVRRKPNRHCSSTSRILVHYQRLSFLWYQYSNSGDHSITQNIWPNNLIGPF